MLLKYSQFQRRSKLGANGKPHRGSVTGCRIPNKGKNHRKGKFVSNKRLNGHRTYVAKREEEEEEALAVAVTVDPTCDNSNDSGLGFEQTEYQPQSHPYNNSLTCYIDEGRSAKKPRIDIKLESDNANDNFTFPQLVTVQQPHRIYVDKQPKGEFTRGRVGGGAKISGKIASKAGRSIGKRGCSEINSAVARSKDGSVCLEIVCQPETQHRARYQTEGSRGAVKDTTGNSFPLVKLSGYNGSEAAVLQVYIGTDQGKVAPHMFYQACKVSGKNSTPCVEKKEEGTVVIEIEFEPSKENLILCDCVGILKERNVDVEHRFPDEATTRSRKKSTRCRMVFKTAIRHPNGDVETLQVTSHPIACTQPPGIPEICKKSLSSCPVTGNFELFIIGKNFLKDTKIKFSEGDPSSQDYWECVVQPDKEYLHQSHLICVVPQYRTEDIKNAATVCISVISGGKSSEPVYFSYTAVGSFPSQQVAVLPSPGVPTSPPPPPTSFFAVTQNLGSANATILQAVPEGPNFSPPQKILIIPSNIELSSSSVSPSALTNDSEVVTKSDRVWIKDEMNVVQNLPQTSSVVTSLTSTSPLQGLTQSSVIQSLSQAPGLMQGLSHPSSQVQGLTQASDIVQGLAQAAGMVQDMTQAGSVVQGLSQVPGVVQALVSPPSLPSHPSSPESLILGVTPPPDIIQSNSESSSPALITEPNVSQASNLIGVSQSPLLQVADMVNSNGVIQGAGGGGGGAAGGGVLRSPPELSPVSVTSVLQSPTIKSASSPLQVTLSEPSVLDNVGQQTTGIMDPTGVSSTLGTARTMDAAGSLMQNPVSQTLMSNTNILSNLNCSHMVPSLGSSPIMAQAPPSLVEASNLVISPSMMPQKSAADISPPPPNSLVHSPNLLNPPGIGSPSLIRDPVINVASNIIPVSTIADATNLIPTASLIDSSALVQQNSLVNSVSVLGSGLASDSLRDSSLVTGNSVLRDGNGGTSFARGLESTAPGGAASAVADLSSGQPPSMATIEKFVSATPLPALSVETYLSHIENKPKVLDPNAFPTPAATEASAISIKRMVATLESKPLENNIFPGKNIENMNKVMCDNSVLLNPSENGRSHLNYRREFLGAGASNYPIVAAREQAPATFGATEFAASQMFPVAPPPAPPAIFQENPAPQEKPKPNPPTGANVKKCEDGIPLPQELTAMSENDLISYINPSCFDQV